MNLNYDKIKSRVEQGSHQWTSYSDLFLVLSVVFLLLYVVANLRNGASSIVQHRAFQAMQKETENLRSQMQAYESLKDEHMRDGASDDEVKTYRALMDQLSLLESDAEKKHQTLAEQAREAAKKRTDLNSYQQLVKNIINANLISSGKLKKRDLIIESQTKELQALDTEIQGKEKEITRNNIEIAKAQEELELRKLKLQRAYQANQKTKVTYESEMAKIQNESHNRITTLRKENETYTKQLVDTQSRLDQKNREAEQLMVSLAKKESDFKNSISGLTASHQAALARERDLFQKGLESAKLTAEAKVERERQYRADVERRNQEYQAGLSKLNSDLQGTRNALRETEGRYHSSIATLQKSNDALQRDLNASITKLNEQRRVAQAIKDGFTKAGINAVVDGKTGDVTILFANEYFETDSSSLKPGMRSTLEKTLPIYAKSLFQDPKIASKLSSVEITGFASPTYQGKLVDPSSLSEKDRLAVNYNMDLSYMRAKAIFEYVFDPKRMQFEHQKQLLPYVKVSGKSYLGADKADGRNIANTADYCRAYDCSKSQIVKIRFNLKGE